MPLHLRMIGTIVNPRPECPTCGNKEQLKNIRNISGADLSADGKRLVLATYGGVFLYSLSDPFDMESILGTEGVQITTTNRDGSSMTGDGEFWSGQEGVCFDYTLPQSENSQHGVGIWSVSEHHKKLYYLKCLD